MRPTLHFSSRARMKASFNLSFIFLVLLITSPLSCWAADDWRQNADLRTAQQADRLYDQQKFSAAYKRYLQLAKKGDPFAQYRVSFMRLNGEGVIRNTAEAYAWATLAAESQVPRLVAYHDEVRGLVPAGGLAAAEELAQQYRQEWGRLALAVEARKEARRQLRECTGSRIGTRCDEVYAMQMPKGWSIAPGVGDGSDGGSGAPSGSISNGVGTAGGGAEVRDAEHYREVRAYIRELDVYIANQTGNVEVRDLDDGEPASQPETTADQE